MHSPQSQELEFNAETQSTRRIRRELLCESLRPLRLCVEILFWLTVFAVGLQAGEIRLGLEPELWQKRVSNTGGVAEADAVTFSMEKDGLAIGPWRAGMSSARFEYARRIPVVRGMVVGRYRTEKLYPRQAMVRVQFFAGDKSLSTRTYPLAAAPDWRSFEVPVFRPPADADAIAVSFGLSDKTDGRVTFTDLRVSSEYQAPPFPERHSKLTRPRPPERLAASKYVRIEQQGGAWWLVAPDGKPFFSSTSLTPGTKASAGDVAPERKLYEDFRRLGFNSLAGSHNVQRWAAFNEAQLAAGQPVVIQFRTLETRAGTEHETLVNAAGENPGNQQAQAAAIGGFNHAFPDPFDPKWEASYRERVRATTALVRGKPYYGGWFVDNEREHRDVHRYVWSPQCAAEFRKFLEGKYGEIGKLNKAWAASFESFDELLRRKPDPVLRKGAMYDDFRLFSRQIIRRFNQTVLGIIREEDPGRLVFSNRFMIGEPRDVLDNLDLYRDFDAIAVNIYPANVTAGLDPAERQFLELVHERTGRPVIIGEWSVPALDSGLYDNPKRLDWSYPQTVENQAQRARQAAQFLTDLYNLPFLIGAHWFTWSDIDSAVRQANRGLFKATGEPWRELQDALQALNAEIAAR